MKDLISDIRESWGWIGLEPLEVIGDNDFGNLMVKDVDGKYWRIRPEDLACEVVAANREELDRLSGDKDFVEDWNMAGLVDQAKARLGPLSAGRKYYLVTPSVLGGEYKASNMETLSISELVRLSGDVARQIKDLPDGTQVTVVVKE